MTTNIIEKILAGDVRSVGRLLSRIENRESLKDASLLAELFPHAEGVTVLGVTGSPGAGKSTLVDRLARAYAEGGEKVGIIAVDPTSPFSGGAILGDRIRMQTLAAHPGVFIRSMATRGTMGGLSSAVDDAIVVLGAAGYRRVIVETVGAGQDEVDIARSADVTLVVLVPGMGDEIQTLKAGIMEIGEIFVVNKADREGADKLVREIRSLVSDRVSASGWTPRVVATVAATGEGLPELLGVVDEVHRFLRASCTGEQRRVAAARNRIQGLVEQRAVDECRRVIDEVELDRLSERVSAGETSPYEAAETLLRLLFRRLRIDGPDGKPSPPKVTS